MTQMTDVMVDVETTGLNPQTSAIIQLSAIKFNLAEHAIGSHFDRCPAPLPMRSWNEGTRDFWMARPEVYHEIVSRQERPEDVFLAFMQWIDHDAPEGGYRFWSKPLSFDYPIIASHFEQLGYPMPFHYRIARDMNSYLAGVRGDAEHPPFGDEVEFNGKEHNALHDCAYQIDVLFHGTKKFIATEIM
jgi:DNA polymerase III epsilon subunit-like protein